MSNFLASLVIGIAMVVGITPAMGRAPETQKGKIYQIADEKGMYAYANKTDVVALQKASDDGDAAAARRIKDNAQETGARTKLEYGTEVGIMEKKEIGTGLWVRIKLRNGDGYWMPDYKLVKQGSISKQLIDKVKLANSEKEKTVSEKKPPALKKDMLFVRDDLGYDSEESMRKLTDMHSKIDNLSAADASVEQKVYLYEKMYKTAKEAGMMKGFEKGDRVAKIEEKEVFSHRFIRVMDDDGKVWLVDFQSIIND